MSSYEKIVIITRKTRFEELVERFNTEAQAKFYIEQGGGDFASYRKEYDAYHSSLETLRRSIDIGLKLQWVDRRFLPTFLFAEKDLVVTMGQNGLVANSAKYVGSQPIIAVNPDCERIDGILLPFTPTSAREAVEQAIEGKARFREVTMAEAALSDGQRMCAFNDLFVGASSHISARYRIRWGEKSEPQSSSGIIISTGAGSTGWLSSIFNMASGITGFLGGQQGSGFLLKWEDPRLVFVVREPFLSRHSMAGVVAGMLEEGQDLILESMMPSGGVIFSDGIESDFLQFNSGAIAHIHNAPERARLVVG